MSKISVIIVTYNSRGCIGSCLESIQKEKRVSDIFIVDNASQDGTKQEISKYQKRPAINTVFNKNNFGFTKANNQVVSRVGGEYVVFLNPDTRVSPGSFDQLAGYLDSNPRVGVVGPRLTYGDGRYQISTGQVRWWPYTVFWHLFSYPFLRFLVERKNFSMTRDGKEKDVGWVLGACLMIRRDLLLKLRGFDEIFFLSIMDAMDLCKRVADRGYRVIYFPKAEVTHLGGTSWKQVRSLTISWVYRGYIHYYKKHHGLFAVILVDISFFLSFSARSFILGVFSLVRPRKYYPVFKAYITSLCKIYLSSSAAK